MIIEKYSLIVIDMQYEFDAAKNRRTVRNCSREIQRAMNDDVPIVFVEFIGYGKTKKSLLSKLSSYKKFGIVKKCECGGGFEISNFLKKKKFPFQKLKICGIQTNICVRQTVEQLLDICPQSKIEIVGDACYDVSDGEHEYGLEQLKTLPNVMVA